MTSGDSSRVHPPTAAGRLVSVCLAGALGALAACSADPASSAGGAGRLVAGYENAERAAWSDFDSAVSSALMRNQVAVVERVNVSDTERRWTLRSATDEPGWLTAAIPASGTEPWDDSVEYHCSIGLFGEPEREAAFIESVRAWRPKHPR